MLTAAQIIQALYKAEWWHEHSSQFDLLGSVFLGLDDTLARSYGLWLWPDSSFIVEHNHACGAFPRSQGEQILFLFLFCCTMVLVSFLSAVCIFLSLYYSISKCLYWKLIQRERSYIANIWDTSHSQCRKTLPSPVQLSEEKVYTFLIYTDCHEYLRIVKAQHKPILFWFHLLQVVKNTLCAYITSLPRLLLELLPC